MLPYPSNARLVIEPSTHEHLNQQPDRDTRRVIYTDREHRHPSPSYLRVTVIRRHRPAPYQNLWTPCRDTRTVDQERRRIVYYIPPNQQTAAIAVPHDQRTPHLNRAVCQCDVRFLGDDGE